MTEKQEEYFKKIKQEHSMDIALDKGMNTRIHYTDEKVKCPKAGKDTYQKNYTNPKTGEFHPKGSPRVNWYWQWKPLYSNIIDAWKATDGYLQTSAGLNHSIRNCIVADFDEDIINVYRYKQMPLEPTFIIKNPKTGHGQVFWVLRSGERKEDVYPYMQAMAELLGADRNFRGWQIKNPYSKKVERIVEAPDRTYTLADFVNLFPDVQTDYAMGMGVSRGTGETDTDKTDTKKKAKGTPRKERKAYSPSSRHDGFLTDYRNAIWRAMDRNKGLPLSRVELERLADIVDDNTAKATGKTARRFDSDEERKGWMVDIDSIATWSTEHYRKCGGDAYSDRAREVSVWHRDAQTFLDAIYISSLGDKTIKEVHGITGFSMGKISRLRGLLNVPKINGNESEEEKDRIIKIGRKKEQVIRNARLMYEHIRDYVTNPSEKAVGLYGNLQEFFIRGWDEGCESLKYHERHDECVQPPTSSIIVHDETFDDEESMNSPESMEIPPRFTRNRPIGRGVPVKQSEIPRLNRCMERAKRHESLRIQRGHPSMSLW